MNEALSFLAAVVPALGGLYGYVSTVARDKRLRHERAVRGRVHALCTEWNSELRELSARIEEASNGAENAGKVYDELSPRFLHHREREVLALHGLEPLGAYEQVERRIMAGLSPLTRSELRSQGVMIGSALLGISLLGASLLVR